jgi:hypothetical protein
MRPTDILRFHGARSVTGTNTFDATIAAGDIIAAKIGYGAAGLKVIGIMPENGAINITPNSSSQTIPAGHTSGGSVAAVVVPVANVLSGTTIAGQAGTMVNNGAGGTVTPGTANQTKAAGFWSSLITILGDVALIAANIMVTKTIFGVAGTATADATAGANDIGNGKTAYVNGVKVTGTGASARPHASGSGTTSTTTGQVGNPAGNLVNMYYLTVSGLNFPNGIGSITIKTTGSNASFYYPLFYTASPGGGMYFYDTTGGFLGENGGFYVNTTGFQIPFILSNASVTWEAWGL